MSDATVTMLVSRLALASVEFLVVGLLVVVVLAVFKGVSPRWRRVIWLLALLKPFVTVVTGSWSGVIPVPSWITGRFLGSILFASPADEGLLAGGGVVAWVLHLAVWSWVIVTALLLIRAWLRAATSRQLIDESLEKGYLLKPSKLRRLDPNLVIPPDARVIVTPEDAGPAALGVYRPAVVIPESLLPWMRQLRDPTPVERARFCQVLRHELAHITNHDELVSRVATVLMSFFWFHPVAHRAYRCVRMNNELRCDEQVVASGVKPDEYADTLMNVIIGDFARRGFALSIMGDSSPAGVLRRRLHCLLSERRQRGPRRMLWGCVTVALVVLTMPRFLGNAQRLVDVILADGRVQQMTVAEALNYPGGTYELTPGLYRVAETVRDHAPPAIMLAEAGGSRPGDSDELGEFGALPRAGAASTETAVSLTGGGDILAQVDAEEPIQEEPEEAAQEPPKKKSRGPTWPGGVHIDNEAANTPILPPPSENR